MGAAGYGLAGVSLIGTGIGAWSQWRAGQDAKHAANFNARMMDLEAKHTIDQGEAAAADIDRTGRIMIGEQRAGLAGQGVELGEGTAEALQLDTIARTRDAIARTRADAALAAWGLRTNAASVRRSGRMAARGGTMNAIGTGLSGTAQAGAMFARAEEKTGYLGSFTNASLTDPKKTGPVRRIQKD